MLNENSLKGIGLFQSEVLHLISLGKTENFEEIEKNMEEGKIIEYIFEKYNKEFSIMFNNDIYNNKELNLFFQNAVCRIKYNEDRKYGIMNKNDGLLLILALISEKIESEAINWENNN